MDPCDLRQNYGDTAIRDLVAGRIPLFEFAVRSTLAQVDLDTAEGRIAGLRASAPVVSRIRDAALRPEYARLLAGWLGMDVETVRRAVVTAQRANQGQHVGGTQPRPADVNQTQTRAHHSTEKGRAAAEQEVHRNLVDRNDPIAQLERQSLEVALQVPELVPAPAYDNLGPEVYTVPAYRAIHDAIRASGGIERAQTMTSNESGGGSRWADSVREMAALPVAGLVTELAVAPMPTDREDALHGYAVGIVASLADTALGRRIGELRGQLQRMDPTNSEYQTLFHELVSTEERRQGLRNT